MINTTYDDCENHLSLNKKNLQVISLLYRLVLSRDPDPEGLASALKALETGLDPLEYAITLFNSEEFISKGGFNTFTHRIETNQTPSDKHPLSNYSYLYTPKNTPYYSHKSLFRPLMLIIETVNICNNSCVICPYSIHTRKKETMDMNVFTKAVSGYSEIGGGYVSLTPMLGEIFIDKHLILRLDTLSKSPMIKGISATTNATMARRYSDKDLELILSQFKILNISLYGLDKEEFLLMTNKDEYSLMRKQLIRILRLSEKGKVRLSARSLRKRSLDELNDWVDLLTKDAEIDWIPNITNINSFNQWGDLIQEKSLPLEGKWHDRKLNTQQCILPLIAFQILVDGSVSFCGCADFDGNNNLQLGNINDSSLGEILRSHKYAELWDWENYGVPSFCQRCGFHRPMTAFTEQLWNLAEPIDIIGG